jgi:signal transduction histidine kinase
MLSTPETGNVDFFVQAVQDLFMVRDVATVMKKVMRAARNISGADGITFITREGDECYYADEDAQEFLWKGLRIPARNCVSGWAMENRMPVVISNVLLDNRVPREMYQSTFVKSLSIVPIGSACPVGAIGAYWSTEFTPENSQISLLQSLAELTEVALRNIHEYQELERSVHTRTMQLEKALFDLESFSYSVSHDLRAPLRSINSFIELIELDHGHSFSRDALVLFSRVQSNAKQMGLLIESLLSFFKLGKKELVRVNVNMNNLVNEICECILTEEKNRLISINVGQLPVALADKLLLKQVWQNLISNAVKYTGKRHRAMIEIGSMEAGNSIVYYISDNGDGFNMSNSNKLFKVFQRLHSQSEFEGTGIGLAIAEKIVSRHHGKIWAEGNPGKGATFYFTLG